MAVMVDNNGINLLTVAEVAAILRFSKQIVYRMVWDGQLKSVKIRGSIRITREDVEDYIKKQSEQS